ncbi:hypothetical protein NQ317_008804 [Molorchus minor]|uniref:Uncharacterized protein n=1 Tax=Molorchus minor TaxID=1323400 RepID=A0ABQ9IV83_9CUCU|nr:hypothetical protein NQ317_008804 [Molorchus minor]
MNNAVVINDDDDEVINDDDVGVDKYEAALQMLMEDSQDIILDDGKQRRPSVICWTPKLKYLPIIKSKIESSEALSVAIGALGADRARQSDSTPLIYACANPQPHRPLDRSIGHHRPSSPKREAHGADNDPVAQAGRLHWGYSDSDPVAQENGLGKTSLSPLDSPYTQMGLAANFIQVVKYMDLTKLNQVAVLETKPLIKISDLPENIPQPILSADIMTTKYGETILIEFEESKAFLPKKSGGFNEGQPSRV